MKHASFAYLVVVFAFAQPSFLVNPVNGEDTADISPETDKETRPLNGTNPHRIVGGRPINIQRVPWQLALIEDNRIICGASIISPYFALTAAHCTTTKGKFILRAGTRKFKSGGQTRRVDLIVRRGYVPATNRNDIAVLRVTKAFVFGPKCQPIKLAQPGMPLPKQFFVSGWGLRQANQVNPQSGLRMVQVQLVNHNKCVADYAGTVKITPQQICAAAPGKDSCQGDSGGALVKNHVQYGIVSFGIGCALPRFPGAYTDVRLQRKWIVKVVRKYGRDLKQSTQLE